MVEITLSDFPNLKICKWITETIAFTLGQTKVIRYTVPTRKIFFIDMTKITPITATETVTFNSVEIDGVPLLNVPPAASTTAMYYNSGGKTFASSAVSAVDFPIRRYIEFSLTNGVIAGNITIDLWVYSSNDPALKYKVESETT